MKGKEAVRSARRREAEAQGKAESLKTQLSKQKREYEGQVTKLKAELAGLRGSLQATATSLAEEEIVKAQRERDTALARCNEYEETLADLAEKKDLLAFNACKYLSMVHGHLPMGVIRTVITWMTGESYRGSISSDFLVEQGLPAEGWVVTTWKRSQYAERSYKKMVESGEVPEMQSVDDLEQYRVSEIHPKYRKHWYQDARPKLVPRRKDSINTRVRTV